MFKNDLTLLKIMNNCIGGKYTIHEINNMLNNKEKYKELLNIE